MNDAPKPHITKLANIISLLALVILISLTVARTMLNEPTFGRGPIIETGIMGDMPVSQQIYTPYSVLRVLAALIIFFAGLAWAVSGAMLKKLPIIRPGFLLLTVICSGGLFASAYLNASDQHNAIINALEQSSLLMCCWLTMQLACTPTRRRLVMIAIVAMAAVLGAKALHQVFVEIPEQVKYFNENRQAQLESLGFEDNTPEAVMLEARIVERTAKGFFSLANIFGSLMVLLSASCFGIAMDKFLHWHALVRSGEISREKGEIPLPLAAGVISMAASLMAVYACIATQSIGAAASLVFAFALAAMAAMNKKLIAKHRKKLILTGIAATLVLISSVIAIGITRGSLPSRTLQVRWEYWTGSIELLKQNPLLGVGPGEFDDPYLAIRTPGAEESVKNPHNIIAQSLSEYGLIGGLAYLGCFVYILLGICVKPDEEKLQDSQSNNNRTIWICSAIICAGTLGWRIFTSYYPNPTSLFVDNFIPIFILPAGLLAGIWATDSDKSMPNRMTVIFTACGMGGFALHNLSDFAIFSPGSAMVFYLIAGACVGTLPAKKFTLNKLAAHLTANTATILIIFLAMGIYGPISNSERFCYSAAKDISVSRAARTPEKSSSLVKSGLEKLSIACGMNNADAKIPFDIASLSDRFADAVTEPQLKQKYYQMSQQFIAEAKKRDPQSVKIAEKFLEISAKAIIQDVALLPGPADTFIRVESTQYDIKKLSADQINALAMSKFAYDKSISEAIALMELAVKKYGTSRPMLLSNAADLYWLDGQKERARKLWQKYYAEVTQFLGDPQRNSISQMISDIAARDSQYNDRRLKLAQIAWKFGLTDFSRNNALAAKSANDALHDKSVVRFDNRKLRLLEMTLARTAAIKP